MTLQIRPIGATPVDRAYYNPGRDLANCGVNISRVGMQILDNWLKQESAKKFLENNGITVTDVLNTVDKLGSAFQDIYVLGSLDALEKSGFSSAPTAAKLFILAALGRAFLDATFFAVKDTFSPDGTPPLSVKEFCNFVQTLANTNVKF